MPDKTTFHTPPATRTQDGAWRRAGFELEFAGISLHRVAAVVAEHTGGAIDVANPFHQHVRGTPHGDYSVELDAMLLKNRAYLDLLEELSIEMPKDVREPLEEMLARVASLAVPVELVTPPLPFSAFDVLADIETALRGEQAKGSRSSIFYAFGMQINAECVSLRTDWLLPMLRAFLLLFDWLKQEIDVDFSRRLSPYIDPFPAEYARLVLDPAYAPGFTAFADDYLRFNPTRNRPLDLLPVLAERDEARVRAAVGAEHKVNKRPALHYRLPNCLIDTPGWNVALEWNRWVKVEELAHDPDRLEAMSRSYLKHHPGGVEE